MLQISVTMVLLLTSSLNLTLTQGGWKAKGVFQVLHGLDWHVVTPLHGAVKGSGNVARLHWAHL
jgi:hypothetical protein